MKPKHYAYFQNTACEFFPCHPGADPERFNCLFCYCPLYCLGEDCGGAFTYTETGIKDCSACLFPHDPDNYSAVNARFGDVVAAMRKMHHAK